MHRSAIEKEQDWASAEKVSEELENLQHGGHVAPVVRAACEEHVSTVWRRARQGVTGLLLETDLGPVARAAWQTSGKARVPRLLADGMASLADYARTAVLLRCSVEFAPQVHT